MRSRIDARSGRITDTHTGLTAGSVDHALIGPIVDAGICFVRHDELPPLDAPYVDLPDTKYARYNPETGAMDGGAYYRDQVKKKTKRNKPVASGHHG